MCVSDSSPHYVISGRVSRADTGQHIVNMMRANSAGHMADRRKHTIKTGADIVPDVNTRGFTPGRCIMG